MKQLLLIILILTSTVSIAKDAYRTEYFIGEEIVYSPDKSSIINRKQVAHKTIYDEVNKLVHDIAHFPSESRVFSMSYTIPNNVVAIEVPVQSPIPGLDGKVRFYGQRWSWYGFTVKISIPNRGSMNIFGHYHPNGGFFAVKEIYSLDGCLLSINETEYLRVSKSSFDKITNAD